MLSLQDLRRSQIRTVCEAPIFFVPLVLYVGGSRAQQSTQQSCKQGQIVQQIWEFKFSAEQVLISYILLVQRQLPITIWSSATVQLKQTRIYWNRAVSTNTKCLYLFYGDVKPAGGPFGLNLRSSNKSHDECISKNVWIINLSALWQSFCSCLHSDLDNLSKWNWSVREVIEALKCCTPGNLKSVIVVSLLAELNEAERLLKWIALKLFWKRELKES